MQPLTLGGTLAHYRLDSILGKGGMGVVYLAQDTQLHRRVALKVLAPDRLDDSSRDRLRAEALILSSLSHPNVATVFDFGCERDIDYLVMEFVPGVTMDALLLAAPFATERVVALGFSARPGSCGGACDGCGSPRHQTRQLACDARRVPEDSRLRCRDITCHPRLLGYNGNGCAMSGGVGWHPEVHGARAAARRGRRRALGCVRRRCRALRDGVWPRAVRGLAPNQVD